MISILLQTAARYIMIFQTVLSVFFLLRGHNLPGGGFIGGLLIASSFVLYTIAFDVNRAQKILYFRPERILGFGLLLALFSSLFSVLGGQPLMTSQWFGNLNLPGFGKIGMGTPFLFDVGVYFVVLGMTVTVVFSLYQKNKSPDDELNEVGS